MGREYEERVRKQLVDRNIETCFARMLQLQNRMARVAMVALGGNILALIGIGLAIWALV